MSLENERALRLGVLDLCLGSAGQTAQDVLRGSLEQAVHAEALGYSRYWLAEHHGPGTAHSSPEIMVSVIAQLTRRIRVGTAGVLLNYRSPLKVAKDFRLLQALFPGRIDLGVGAARVDEETARALLGSDAPPQEYNEKVRDLVAYLRGQKRPTPTPAGVGVPDVWVLGSGGMNSALMAAKNGVGYGMALFLAAQDDPAAVQAYRAHFQPSRAQVRPRWKVAVGGICADTDEEAQRLAALNPNPFLAPNVIGDPEQCSARLQAIAGRYETDEIIVLSLIGARAPRLRSYELLAQALGLEAPCLEAVA